MAFELQQKLKLSQQLIMTPQLQMAIKLLQLSRLELIDTVRQEMEENPTLEEVTDIAVEEKSVENSELEPDKTKIKEVTIEEKIHDDIDWSNYLDEYNSSGRIHFETEKKAEINFESFVAQKESLHEHLLWQFLMTPLTKEEEGVGSLIIGNLDKDGYLKVSAEELAESGGSITEKVEKILSIIQTFDPIGVCARDLRECLLIQARHLGLDDTIITEIIKNHLKHLENKNYKAIARALKVSIEEIFSAVKIIQGLEPKPGRQFSDEEPQYIIPDIYVYKSENEFRITVNDEGMPKLRISSFYKNTIKKGQKIPDSARDYVQEKMRSAAWLVKSIHQRQKTIYKVVESILKFQRDFFEKGIAYLKPMVLRDVAQDIDMHESTISRVTTNKYVYTPQGIFELKYFFNSSINLIDGDVIASASVQEKMRQIIASENPKLPYSDNEISQILKKFNISIARRTVAKYRDRLKVLPSNKRKQF